MKTCWMLVVMLALAVSARAPAAQAGNPVVVLETGKGTIQIELFEQDAPKSVAQIVRLVKQNFYRGLRFHRVERSLAQFGDPNSRVFTKRHLWGSGGSGRQIGVAEIGKARKHVRGAVGLAHSGDPKRADSQFYIMKAASPSLDGKHAVIGQVISGMDVVDKLAVGDMVTKASVKGAVPQP